ncbi:hypothetical protein LTR53_007904 [Teratosphaeriaceae sp. CCFEE 6253]|nr:hypothetical protein LTR53_007904 [Teratosphaeriaceae sp. CCFEE 6253]
MSGWETEAATSGEAANGVEGGWGAVSSAVDEVANGVDATEGGEAWGGGGETAPKPEAKAPKPTLTKEEYEAQVHSHGWGKSTPFDYEEFKRTGGDSGKWGGQAAVYEWKDEYGDVGPEILELERELFGSEFKMKKGEHYDHLATIKVRVDATEKVVPIREFDQAGLHPVMLRNIMLSGYTEPTPIQMYMIPAVLASRDVVAISQTGSGKTAAYLIPVISKLMGKAKKLSAPKPNRFHQSYNPRTHKVKAEPLVVIVVPTRELAVQIFDETRRMCYRSMLRPCVSYGGFPVGQSIEDLGAGCDILIATPGRLCDLMGKPDVLTMSRVKYTIIDEADEMLNSDWEEELKTIMAGGDTNEDADHVFLMFSATFPKVARDMAGQYMTDDYARIRVGRTSSAHRDIRQSIIYVDRDQKREAVYDLLLQGEPKRTLIFCNSKAAVDLLDDFLYNRGLPTTSIHSDRNQKEREDAMRAFRTGKCPILVATGISARGWDVSGIHHVINFDLPSHMYGGIVEYTHRIGRTARIGHQGLATSFYNERDEDMAQALVNVLVECECEVPEFLSHLKPEEGGTIDFDDDTDEETEAAEAEGVAEESGAVAAGGAWGAAPETAEGGFQADEGGFQAESGFKAEGQAVAAGGW